MNKLIISLIAVFVFLAPHTSRGGVEIYDNFRKRKANVMSLKKDFKLFLNKEFYVVRDEENREQKGKEKLISVFKVLELKQLFKSAKAGKTPSQKLETVTPQEASKVYYEHAKKKGITDLQDFFSNKYFGRTFAPFTATNFTPLSILKRNQNQRARMDIRLWLSKTRPVARNIIQEKQEIWRLEMLTLTPKEAANAFLEFEEQRLGLCRMC